MLLVGGRGRVLRLARRRDGPAREQSGPGVARPARTPSRPCAPGNVVLLHSDERLTRELRELAERTRRPAGPGARGGRPGGARAAAAEPRACRSPPYRDAHARGRRAPTTRRCEAFIEYWLGRRAVTRPTAARSRSSQMNAVVGDIAGNEARSPPRIARARDAGAQLVVLPRARADRLSARGPAAQGALPRRRPRRAGAPRRRHDGIVAIVGYPERAEDVHNAAAVLADGRLQASYRKQHLPNYGVFDELRYFQPGERGRDDRGRRRHRRADDLRGHLAARPAAVRRGAVRRARDRQPLRLAVPRRQGRAARADDPAARARRARRGRVLRARRRPGRARLRRPLGRRRPRGHGDRAGAAVRGGAADRRRRSGARRLRAPARHAPPRARRARPDSVDRLGSFTVRGDRRRAPARPTEPALAPQLDIVEEVYGALVLGTRDYAAQERLRARRARPERRDRLDARRAHRRRRARRRARDLRDDALAVLLDGHAQRRASGWPRTSASSCSRSRSRR